MPNIVVTLPGKGRITFPDGTSDSVINETIAKEFPKDGADVARMISENPNEAKNISNEDFDLYEKFLDSKKMDLLQTALGAAGGIVETVGKGIKGLFEIRNLSPEVAASTALESGLQGTRDLYGMVAQSEDPSSFFFKFKDLLDGTSSVAERKKQWLEARDFVEQTQKYEAGKETVSGLDPALVNNDVKNTLKLIADPTLFIPGVGEVLGAGKFGTRATGLAMKGTGAVATAVTKPLSEFIGGVGRMAGEAIGADAGKLRNVAAGAGVTGYAMGIPGVSEAAAVVGAIEGVNKAGQVLERAGEQLMNAPTRIGALESLALNPNASSFDRAIAKVGRYGGDDIIDIGSRTLAGGVEGAAIGTVLGGLAGGEEGAAAGFGSGGVLGAGGAGIARVVDKASGKAAVEARHNDFNRFYENLDKDTQSKFDTVVKNSGIDGAAQVMDISGIIRGKFNDADVRFSTADEFATKYGQDARGVQIVEGERPVVDINVDKFNSQATVGHELFHAFKAIDQLRPLVERAEQMIVGNYVIDGNGQSVRTTPGLLDDASVLKKFDEYVTKLKPDENSKWAKANTLVEKSKLVGEELGAEYMSRLIQGSDTDAMLRGFDGLTRTILDKTLLSNTEGFLRRTVQSLGLGTKPIESLVFTKLEQASPALNAALRDMVRARRNMNKKIELAEDTGFAIRNRDLANPAAAKIATDMGIAETGVDGVTRMKPDDVLAQEDRASSDALIAAIKSAPVVDVNEPRLREVDGQIVGDGISNAQLAAIQASPNIIDKVKKGIVILKDSIENGNVIFIRNGKATKEITNRLTGKTLKRYNDGVRITERDIVPYALATNKAGELFTRTFDISKARNEAMSLASRDRLGPYKSDFQTFYGDLARYLNNLSDRENAVPTKELFGDAAKAAYMTDFFGGKNDTAAKYIRNFTLDRMIDMRPTGEKVSMSQIAYDRNKARFMPAENLGESKVFNSPDTGLRIISKNNKHSLYAPTGERIGIYDTQAKAEAKAGLVLDKFAGDVARNVPVDNSLSTGQKGDVGKWISTRKPTAKGAYEDALKQNLIINSDAVIGDPAAQKRVVSLIKDYPGFKSNSKDPQTIINDFKSFVVDNLLYLHDSMDPALRQRAQKWYDGARKISEQWSEKTGFSRDTVAAVLASLSPQTDWFRNVAQAERAINIFKDNQNSVMSPAMDGWLSNYFEGDKDGAKIIDAMRGKKFSDLSTYEKAVWTRAYDQVNNPRDYRILTPEGSFADLVRKQDGSPAAMGWGNFKTLSNAMSILENPSRANISERLGGEHKVRSFYNNILLPDLKAFGDVTIDTHAVAAGLLRPLAGADTEVSHNLGAGISSATTGASGIYGIYADAYRDAAKQRGILPRQMQSITWEAVRGLFTAEWKTKANKELVNNIWNEYKKGNLTKDEARSQISKAADGIKTPDWARSDSRATEQTQDRGNTRELPKADVRWNPIATVDSRGRANASTGSEKSVGNFQPAEVQVTFQPAEKLPNGQAWSTDNNYRVIQKDGGKFRVYAPTGAMIGVADTLDKSKKLIEKKSR